MTSPPVTVAGTFDTLTMLISAARRRRGSRRSNARDSDSSPDEVMRGTVAARVAVVTRIVFVSWDTRDAFDDLRQRVQPEIESHRRGELAADELLDVVVDGDAALARHALLLPAEPQVRQRRFLLADVGDVD